MPDKFLTEKEWKNFARTSTHKDAAIAKALAALDKAEGDEPDAQLKALAEVERQSALLLKTHKADKALASYLADLDKAAVKHRKALLEAQKQAAEAAKAEEEDEPDSALLDPAVLLSQLQRCKRDAERSVAFAYVDDKDKQPGVLAMSPKMSGRKMFARLQAETGVKAGAHGTAWIDGDSLMIQLDKPMSGLVKKLRAPVKACGFRIARIVLWNADGSVFEQDDDGVVTAPGAATAAAPGAPTGATTGTPEQTAATPSASGPGVAFTQLRLVWDQTRKKVQSELRRLEAQILETCKTQDDLADIAAGTKNLYLILEVLDERLIDKLDEALNATTAEARDARHAEARLIVDEYVAFLGSEPLLLDIDEDNGFVSVAVRSTLTASLSAIGSKLTAPAR